MFDICSVTLKCISSVCYDRKLSIKSIDVFEYSLDGKLSVSNTATLSELQAPHIFLSGLYWFSMFLESIKRYSDQSVSVDGGKLSINRNEWSKWIAGDLLIYNICESYSTNIPRNNDKLLELLVPRIILEQNVLENMIEKMLEV